MIDDGHRIAQAIGDDLLILLGKRRSRACDRTRIRLQPEQTGPDLVVQFERRAPPFVVLCSDQLPIELQVLRASGFERAGKRVEMIGDGGELPRLRAGYSHIIAVPFQIGEAAGERGQRAEHAAEQNVEDSDHRHIEEYDRARYRGRVLPELGDFVAGFADDLDLADFAAIDDDRDVSDLDRRCDQFGEPAWCRGARGDVRGRHCAYRKAGLVLHRDPHMADRAQLHRQVRQKSLGGKLLMRERRGVADKRLGEVYGCRHLDAGLRARPQHRNAAADEQGGGIDQHENHQELRAQ